MVTRRMVFRSLLCGSMTLGIAGSLATESWAQQRQLQRTQPSKSSNPNTNRPPAKVGAANAQDAAKKDIINLYTDAANFQNAGAYPLAVDAWKKFLAKYPKDELSSKARHYLGVCYLQLEKPDYAAAVASFREALGDPKLEVREETLINLGWTLFYTARPENSDKPDATKLREALKVLNEFLDKYPDGTYADKATFYAAESEYQLGNIKEASTRYRLLAANPKFEKSTVLPDALYALGVAYEEQKQPKLAAEVYDRFLKDFANHRLAREVSLRKAEFLISSDDASSAAELLSKVADDKEFAMRDYVLYRYGFALAKAGRYDESSKVYQQLAQEYPNSQFSTDSNLSAGQALMREKKYDQAKEFFQKLLPNKDEVATQAAHWLAQIAVIENKPNDVISIAREALGWAKESQWRIALQIDLADALASTPDGVEEANGIYESVALEHEDHPSAPRAAYSAAFNALKLGKADDATKWAEFFAKRFAKDPLAGEVAFIRAESLLQAGKRADAAAAFEQLIAAYPDSPNVEQWQLRTGTAYFFAENFDKAKPILDKLSKNAKSAAVQGESLFLLGASYFKQSKFSEAIESLNKSISIEPAWPGVDEAFLILAEAHSKAGDNAQAKAILEQLLSKFPNSPFKTQAQFRLGQLSASASEFDKAIALYNAVLSSKDEPDLIDYARYGKAWVLIQQSKFNDALNLALSLVKSSSDPTLRLESSLAASVCLREVNKPEEAVNILDAVLRDSASQQASQELQAKLLLEQGINLSQANQFERASQTFQKLASQFPSFPNIDKAIYEHAWSLKRGGRDDLAIAAFKELGSKFPNSVLAAEAYYHVGQQSYEQQEFDSAVKAYTIAMTKTNDDFVREKSLYKLGWTYYQTQKWSDAAKFFADLAREYSDGDLIVDAVFMQGECAMKQNRFKEAVPHYKQARNLLKTAATNGLEVDPQVADLIHLHGAQAARENKDWPTVVEFVDQLNERSPESPYGSLAMFEKAIALQNQKSLDQSLEAFRTIAESNRNELGARARFMIGEIHFSKRDFSSAIQEYQRVMYGYGATQAPVEIKNWQARAAVEAGRCSDLLIGDLTGDAKLKAINVSKGFYEFVAKNHSEHEMAALAKERLAELEKLK